MKIEAKTRLKAADFNNSGDVGPTIAKVIRALAAKHGLVATRIWVRQTKKDVALQFGLWPKASEYKDYIGFNEETGGLDYSKLEKASIPVWKEFFKLGGSIVSDGPYYTKKKLTTEGGVFGKFRISNG
jgi:hypothetical protein